MKIASQRSINREDNGGVITVCWYEKTRFHTVTFDSITARHFLFTELNLSVQKLSAASGNEDPDQDQMCLNFHI